ncbi:MAG: hypothetical protein IPK55_10445 [Streptococcus sp.]|jgi:hypothetical protein|nr:hypothetical protein [Streptococcus sp.]
MKKFGSLHVIKGWKWDNEFNLIRVEEDEEELKEREVIEEIQEGEEDDKDDSRIFEIY